MRLVMLQVRSLRNLWLRTASSASSEALPSSTESVRFRLLAWKCSIDSSPLVCHSKGSVNGILSNALVLAETFYLKVCKLMETNFQIECNLETHNRLNRRLPGRLRNVTNSIRVLKEPTKSLWRRIILGAPCKLDQQDHACGD